jgi:hypothetical protein
MNTLVIALLLLADNGPVHIWFNLLEHTPDHKWRYVDSLETLEECQDLRVWYEQSNPGNYYCLPAQVTFTKGENHVS